MAIDWKTTIIADPRFAAFKKKFMETWKQILDVDSLNREIENLHLSRRTKDLRLGSENFVQTLIDVNVQDVANRGRLCHIKLEINNVSAPLQQHRDALTEHLMTAYVEDLHESGYRSKEAKINAIHSLKVFGSVNTFLTDLELLWSNADLVINDIDQAGYSLKRITDAMQIHTNRGTTL